MEETSILIIEKITETYSAPRRLENELEVSVFYACERLSPSDLARLAAEVVGHLPQQSFDAAVGLAYTGILFAAAVAGGKQVAILKANNEVYGAALKGKRVIIVDDVVYSGKRLLNAQKILEQLGAQVVGFACIVDRSTPQALQLNKPLWSVLKTELK